MHSLVIFASGTGTNTRAIIDHFKKTGIAKVSLIVSNKADAGVLNIAIQEEIPFLVIDRKTIHETLLIDQLQSYQPSLIILAGFLWQLPASIIHSFLGRIINIHPALLPHFGGKGMYGDRVHTAVLASGRPESGITIHFVNENYDEGQIILQAHCEVLENDTVLSLAQRIHHLEHFYFPQVIEFLLSA